jgi:para-nitrobenzyl esterase
MASPLSRNLFQRAIRRKRRLLPRSPTAGMQLRSVSVTEQTGLKFAESVGAKSPWPNFVPNPATNSSSGSSQIQQRLRVRPQWPTAYYLPTDVASIYAKREQAKVPLLAGWNADEGKAQVLMSPEKTTAASFKEMAKSALLETPRNFSNSIPPQTTTKPLSLPKRSRRRLHRLLHVEMDGPPLKIRRHRLSIPLRTGPQSQAR